MAPSSQDKNTDKTSRVNSQPALSSPHLSHSRLQTSVSKPKSLPVLPSIKTVLSNTMTPKSGDKISPSRFGELAFRNPFSTPRRIEKLASSPNSIPCASDSISPISTQTATTSCAVSTVASISSTVTTSAEPSPDSEDCPEIADHVCPHQEATTIKFGMKEMTVDHDTEFIASTEVSPFGSPRKDSGLDYYFRPRGTTVDGGADSLQSNMSASKRAKLSPIRLSGSPLAISRPTSLAGSFQSGLSDQSIKTMRSYGSSIGDGGDWDFDILLDMTDEVRVVLQVKGIVPQSNIEELNSLLDAFLREEIQSRPSTEIELIIHTRFDQLLREIVNSRDSMCIDPYQEAIFTKAASLKRKWERRFKGLYWNIQRPRTEQMKINGALRGVPLATGDGDHGQSWHVRFAQSVDLEGHLNFLPGDWWLNLHCALRDGAVGSVDNALTPGKSGVVAFALLSGEETNGPTLNMFEYTKTSPRTDELMKLVTCNRGRPIRILRGSSLKSKYAPKAGIRYDGLHVVKQFGHKLLDESKNIYRCTIMLERVHSQRPLHEVLQFPKPSQLDDWDLYKKIISDDYRMREGDAAFNEWREEEEQEQMEKEQFIMSKALQQGIRQYTVVERKPSYLHNR